MDTSYEAFLSSGGFSRDIPTEVRSFVPEYVPPATSRARDLIMGRGGSYLPPGNVTNFGPGIYPKTNTQAEMTALMMSTPGAEVPAVPGGVVPGGVLGGLGALGLTTLAAVLGTGYVASQAIGVQYPWETGPGEGFIAPWTRDIVKNEQDMWVTEATRPELFGGAPATAMVPQGVAGMGPQVVKQWSANGWPFAMTSDGRIHTVTKSGIRKSWKPYKSVVMGKKISTGTALRAVRKLRSIQKVAKAISKLAK